jgi:hypothetical protein
MDHADAYKSALQLNDLLDEASANEQSWILQDLAQLPFVRTVCETGFNAGHNAFHILTANYDVVIYSFEVRVGVHSFLRSCKLVYYIAFHGYCRHRIAACRQQID